MSTWPLTPCNALFVKKNKNNLIPVNCFCLTVLLLFLHTMTTPAASTLKMQERGILLMATAQANDGVYALLKRYQVNGNKCNINFFYDRNNLRRNSQLLVGKKYFLPIYVYQYDTKSIRSTIGMKSWAKARRIQKYNDDMHQAKLKKIDYRANNALWVPYNEIDCAVTPSKTVKGMNKNRRYSLFGKENSYVPLESSELKNTVFYIVSGHGGLDPGAVGIYKNKYELCEDEYAYDISLRLARNLIAYGATTYMITRDANDGIRSGEYLPCDKDEYCWKNRVMFDSHKKRLQQRSKAINRLYKQHKREGTKHQRAIMLHIDSRSQSERADLFFYYFPGSWAGKKLAKTLRSIIKKKYAIHQKTRGYNGSVNARDLHMLRETRPPSAYIELGNIANKSDQKRFVIESNRQTIADWLFEGLLKEYRNSR